MKRILLLAALILLVPAVAAIQPDTVTVADARYSDTVQDRILHDTNHTVGENNLTAIYNQSDKYVLTHNTSTSTVNETLKKEKVADAAEDWVYEDWNETGKNGYLFDYTELQVSGGSLSVTLEPNNITMILLDSYNPLYSDDEAVRKLNKISYWNGGDWNQTSLDTAKEELLSMPVKLNGELVESVDLSNGSLTVSVSVQDGDMVEIGNNTLVVDVQTVSDWNDGTFNGTSADRRDNSGILGIGYRNGSAMSVSPDGYWRLDTTSSDVLDYSESGTNYDAPDFSITDRSETGVFGTYGALMRRGDSDYIDIENTIVGGSSTVSGAVWVRLDSYGSNTDKGVATAFMGEGGAGGSNFPSGNSYFAWGVNGTGHMVLYWDDGSAQTEESNYIVPKDEWVHLAFTVGSSGTRFYENGKQVYSQSSNGHDTLDSASVTFSLSAWSKANWMNVNGSMDEPMVETGREWSGSTVQELYRWGTPFNADYNSSTFNVPDGEAVQELEVDATSLTSQAEAWATVTTNKSESQTVKLDTNGTKNYTLDFSNTGGGAWVEYNFSSPDETQTAEVNDFTLHAGSTADTTGPSITIHDPQNQTYSSSTLDLNVTADESVDVWQYSKDGGANETFTPNSSITVSDGETHTVTVYANDSNGNTGKSSVTFTVEDLTPPQWRKLQDNVTGPQPQGSMINISAEWQDTGNGLDRAVLSINDTGTWRNYTERHPNQVWNYSSNSDYFSSVEADSSGNVYAGGIMDDGSYKLHKINSEGGNVWNYTGHTGTITGVDMNGTHIATSSRDGTSHLIDSDGTRVWNYSYSNINDIWAVSMGDNGSIHLGVETDSNNHEVHKVGSDGSNVWNYTQHDYFVNDLEVDENGNVYTASEDNDVHKIGSDGNTVWTYDEHVNGVEAVGVQNGYVYSATDGGEIHRMDTNGNKVWERDIDVKVFSAVVDDEGNLYIATDNGGNAGACGSADTCEVQKVNSNGDTIWRYTGHDDLVNGVDADSSGYVYSTSPDDTVHKIDQIVPFQFDGIADTWRTSHFTWQNDSFTGSLGYKIYGNDTSRNWNVTDRSQFLVNRPPIQKNGTVRWKQIGGSVTEEAIFGYEPTNGVNISSVGSPPSGSITEQDNYTATVSDWVSPFDWMATVTDQYGQQGDGRELNFTTTENYVQVENATGVVNESQQTVNTSVALDVRGDAMNYSVTAADPGAVKQTVRDDDQSSVTSTGITGSQVFTWYWAVDTITETVFSEYGDTTVSHTLSSQGIARKKQFDNNGSISWSRLNVSAPPISGTCSNCDEREISVNGNSAVNETYNSTGDFISSETRIGYRQGQNTTYSSNTSMQRLWNQTALQVDNSKGFQFAGVDLTVECDVTTSANVGSGTVNATTSCTNETYSVDAIDETEYDFSPNTDSVTLGGPNYFGQRQLELANQKPFAWTDLDTTSGVTPPRGCSQTNNTAVNLSSSATENYTVQFSCDPGDPGDPGLIKTLDATPSNDTRYNYTTIINVSSNETRTINVSWEPDKDELNDWADRINSSGSINGNTTGVEVQDKTNVVQVTFTTDCCSSSPSQGEHRASLVYYVAGEDTTSTDDGSSGGPGGSPIGDDEDDNTGFRLRIRDLPRVSYNQTQTLSLSVENFVDQENTVTLEAQPERSNGCQYIGLRNTVIAQRDDNGRITVQEGDRFGDESTMQLPGREPDQTRVFITGQFIQVSMPDQATYDTVKNENGTIRCVYEATASHGTVDDLVVEVQPGFNVWAFLQALINRLATTLSGGEFTHVPLSAGFDLCTGDQGVNASLNGEECPEEARQTVPVLPIVAVLVMLVIGGAVYRWRR